MGLVFLGTVPGVSAQADQAVNQVTSALGALSRDDRAQETQTDIVFGRGVRGPYLLTWRGMRQNSESVVRDGVPLLRDRDYTLDAAEGMLSFADPLGAQQVARIVYRYDTATARPNLGAERAPLKWDLWQAGASRVRFYSVYRAERGADGKSAEHLTALSALELAAHVRPLRGADLGASLFLDGRGGNWLDRSGLRLEQKTQAGIAELALEFTHAGTAFAQEKLSGLTAGRDILDVTGRLTPARGLTVTSRLRRTDRLPEAGSSQGAHTTEEIGTTAAYGLPKNRDKIEVGRQQVTDIGSSGERTVTTRDEVKLERQVAKGTRVATGFEASTSRVTSLANSGANRPVEHYTQRATVGLDSRPDPRLAVNGSFSSAPGDVPGGEDTARLRVEMAPFAGLRQLKVTAGWEDRFRADGAFRSREALLELPPLPVGQTLLSGGVRETGAPGSERRVGLVNASSRPLRYLEARGAVRLRDGFSSTAAPDPSLMNTYDLHLAASPLRRLRVTGTFTHNPEKQDGAVRWADTRLIGLETEFGALRLSGRGGAENEYSSDSLMRRLELEAALRITPRDTLTTGYQGRNSLGKSLVGSAAYTLAFVHRLGSAVNLSLSGSYSREVVDGSSSPDKTSLKAEARLGLRF